MSFILDALRKSENERQKNASPGLADVRVRTEKPTRKLWFPLVAVMLGINVVVLVYLWLWQPDGAVTNPVAQQGTGPVGAASARDPQPLGHRENEVRRLSQEAGRSTPTAATAQPAAAVPAALIEQVADDSRLPNMHEILVAGIVSLPPLHLDIHVYSDVRAERFVFINMAKYREGAQLEEGPTVQEITAAGVVLNHQGNRFLLTRE